MLTKIRDIPTNCTLYKYVIEHTGRNLLLYKWLIFVVKAFVGYDQYPLCMIQSSFLYCLTEKKARSGAN